MTIAHEHIRHTTIKTRNKPQSTNKTPHVSSQRSGDWCTMVAKESVTRPPSPAQNLSATGLSHYKRILLINFTPRKFRIGKPGGNRNYIKASPMMP